MDDKWYDVEGELKVKFLEPNIERLGFVSESFEVVKITEWEFLLVLWFSKLITGRTFIWEGTLVVVVEAIQDDTLITEGNETVVLKELSTDKDVGLETKK